MCAQPLELAITTSASISPKDQKAAGYSGKRLRKLLSTGRRSMKLVRMSRPRNSSNVESRPIQRSVDRGLWPHVRHLEHDFLGAATLVEVVVHDRDALQRTRIGRRVRHASHRRDGRRDGHPRPVRSARCAPLRAYGPAVRVPVAHMVHFVRRRRAGRRPASRLVAAELRRIPGQPNGHWSPTDGAWVPNMRGSMLPRGYTRDDILHKARCRVGFAPLPGGRWAEPRRFRRVCPRTP